MTVKGDYYQELIYLWKVYLDNDSEGGLLPRVDLLMEGISR